MLRSRTRSRLAAAGALTAGLATAVAVGLAGELSTGAHVAVLTAGAVVAGTGLAVRAGDGSPPAGRRARALLCAAVLVLGWELVALTAGVVPTFSDLLDPVLAPPVARAAATLVWLAAGARLVARPGRAAGAAMRTTTGRVLVLGAWLWVGLHFLAR